MSTDQTDTNHRRTMPVAVSDDQRYGLASDIVARQRARSEYIRGISFGEPCWDILLDLFVAEGLHHPATIADIAARIGLQEIICSRYVHYMLDQQVLFKNANSHSAKDMPFLISPESREGIRRWLDQCLLSEWIQNS
ncbi:hypothetical protein [Parasphingorhabdus sp.]|uniref:hypothetical protein n=1 Tax=Parasphingorhabdus sp. TaxID=2709688 RepID=UPI0030023AA0